MTGKIGVFPKWWKLSENGVKEIALEERKPNVGNDRGNKSAKSGNFVQAKQEL